MIQRYMNRMQGNDETKSQKIKYQANIREIDVVDEMRHDYFVHFHSHKWWH